LPVKHWIELIDAQLARAQVLRQANGRSAPTPTSL
jgi:hypothetical protein